MIHSRTKLLSVAEISKILNITEKAVWKRIKEKKVEYTCKRVCDFTGRQRMHFNYNQVLRIIGVFEIQLVNKVKKPYFEFSEQIFESKMNKHA